MTPALAKAREVLVALVSAPSDRPWMLAHQILALGAEDRRVAPIMQALSADRSFPRTEGHDTHTDLLLKNLLEAGVDPARPWSTPHGPVTLAEVWTASVVRARLDPDRQASSWTSPGDMGWSLQAFADGAPGRPLRWDAEGTPMDLDTLVRFAGRVLSRESVFLVDAQTRGFSRAGQPLFDLPCGGAHLLQGLSWAVGEGFGDRAEAERLLRLHAWRWVEEEKLLVGLRAEAKADADALLFQELKVVGHALETLGKAEAMGVVAPDGLLTGQVQSLADGLGSLVPRLPAHTAEVPDAVGDAAHALRGLDLVTGAELSW